jgi:hypothetical protein
MMELYAIDVFVDLLRRYGNASPRDEYAFSDKRVMLIESLITSRNTFLPRRCTPNRKSNSPNSLPPDLRNS